MTVNYLASSPYYSTRNINNRLEMYNPRTFPIEQDDKIYEIDHIYNNRPDLLAYDLYDKPGLWWVFAVRNPGILIDPVFDFMTGVLIYLPQRATLENSLEI